MATKGTYTNEWKPTIVENPNFLCKACHSNNVWYRNWESSCGGYEDVHYECRNCNKTWWVESSDS